MHWARHNKPAITRGGNRIRKTSTARSDMTDLFRTGTQVTGTLSAFGIDADAGKAVLVYDAAISTDHGKSVRTRRFEAKVSVGKIEPENVGRALNAAANKVAEDVAGWISG